MKPFEDQHADKLSNYAQKTQAELNRTHEEDMKYNTNQRFGQTEEKKYVSVGMQMTQESARHMVSNGNQMTEQSEKMAKTMVSNGNQMTDPREKEEPEPMSRVAVKNSTQGIDNANYNSRKGFLRGEATMEPLVTTQSNVDQTQSIVNEH